MAGIKPVQTRSKKSLLPADDRRSRRPQSLLDDAERSALSQHQDQPGAEDISSGQRAGLGDTAEFELLAVGENDGIAGHILLDVQEQ